MSDRETEGEQTNTLQIRSRTNTLRNKKTSTQYMVIFVDSVAHRHKFVNMWETLSVYVNKKKLLGLLVM